MKIALAQINSTVGDLKGNAALILDFYRKGSAQGADLVVFPELALSGYPPRDLLEQPDFLAAHAAALSTIAKKSKTAGLLLGGIDSGQRLHNAAFLLAEGRVIAKRFKSLLPSYDVFDEGRYFQPAESNEPVRFKGVKLGISICEDAWNDSEFWDAPRYAMDPVQRQAEAGAKILINLAASPYETGKAGFRLKMLGAAARRHRTPFLCCAAVGGNDELIFDGGSFAVDSAGKTAARARAFEQDLLIVDPFAAAHPLKHLPLDPAEELYKALTLGIRDYARKCGFSRALVGLSGGIDSAVMGVLAADALGPQNVTGIAMPSMFSSPGSLRDARALARSLGIRLEEIPISGIYRSLTRSLNAFLDPKNPGLSEQNLQARIRGILLMAASNKTGALLLSTGNKSELAVGYCTLYGDMNGGLSAIGDVFKTSVYELARWINRDKIRIPLSSIDKPPSAELKADQKDQDDLPPYDELDRILRGYIELGQDAAAIVKDGNDPILTARILEMVDRNEYKRRQAPPALRVSPKAFGTGRRMPMARGRHRG